MPSQSSTNGTTSSGSGDLTRGRRRQTPPLRIALVHGDLTFEPRPILLGHYRSARLTGTERVLNRAIGGAMARSLDIGQYPDLPGSHQVFINRRVDLERGGGVPRPKAVIVAGLGEEGRLQAAQLVHTVRQAVIAWAQRVGDTGSQEPFELAAALLGSGGTRIAPGESARLIAQGVHEANEALIAEDDGWPHAASLTLIELYLDRAAEAWRALRLQQAATPSRYQVAEAVEQGTGGLLRPLDSGYRGTDYDFISVETRIRDGEPRIAFTLDTRRARSEVRGQRAQSALLRELVRTASNDHVRDQRIGQTLFNLLVPIELEAYLAASGEMQIQLDAGTAPIPWELLETPGEERPDPRPWAIRVKLLRKLRLDAFRDRVQDADADASALIIGEPACPPEYPRLEGARLEALAVRDCLTRPSGIEPQRVMSLIGADATKPGADAHTIVSALFEKPWRIVHISGHGVQTGDGQGGGVVLSTGFLGPDEIRTMRVVPELVFVNCCYLARGDDSQLLREPYDRAAFASSVAGALIEIGVRCVVAAGWAVDDAAARAFAETFYGSLLRGNRFIVAVAEARERAHAAGAESNTWAAYQCYGDPDWVLRRDAASEGPTVLADDYSNVGTEVSLGLALERVIVQTVYQGRDLREQRARLDELEQRFAGRWGNSGTVAERFGQAFVELGDVEKGIAWYERALRDPDARASLKAAERLANARSRLGWEIVDTARRSGGDAAEMQRAEVRGRALVRRSLELLAQLIALEGTSDRHSLVGGARKREALIEQAVGRADGVAESLGRMRSAYEEAVRVGREQGTRDLFHPMSNASVADIALNAGRSEWRMDAGVFDALRAALAVRNEIVSDFWSVVSEAELEQYEAICRGRLATAQAALERRYRQLQEIVNAPWRWSSVFDTASLVLGGYAGRAANDDERTAAAALLRQLEGYAHPENA